MNHIEAMKQALEALEIAVGDDAHDYQKYLDAITSLRQAIERAEKPAEWLTEERYAQMHTAKRKWVGLTQKERDDVWYSVRFTGPDELAKAIEAKLKEKNK